MADNRNNRDSAYYKTGRTSAADKIAEQRRRKNALQSMEGPRLNTARPSSPRLNQNRNQSVRSAKKGKTSLGRVYSKQKAPQKSLFGKNPKNTRISGGKFLIAFIIILLVAVLLFKVTNRNAVKIFVDGESIGVVMDKSYNAENLKEICQQRLIASLGTNVEITSTIQSKKVHASKNDDNVGTGDYIIKTATDALSYNVEATSIVVNGTEMAVVASEEVAQTVVDRILSEHSLSYISDISSIIEGPEIDGLEFTTKYVDGTEIMSTDKAYELLNGTKTEQLTYTVQSGDSFGRIASLYGLTVSELAAANPNITDTTRISVGDQINVNATVPIIDIKVVTQTIDRSSGTAVIRKTTYLNGIETDSSTIDSTASSGESPEEEAQPEEGEEE